jgi:hypothetical protein
MLTHPPCGPDVGEPTQSEAQARSRSARNARLVQRLRDSPDRFRNDGFRSALARAELAGEISEFYALICHAILALADGSEFAGDYLMMAEAVAASPYEQAVVAETRTTHDLQHNKPFAAAERCLTTLDRGCYTDGLWKNLLIALSRLGDTRTVDAALRRLAELDDERTARLVESLSGQLDLLDLFVA